MKSLLALIFILCCTSLVKAQNTVGSNGPNGGNGTGADMGKALSNGNVPNPNEQTQNRPDSSLRSQDTTYMQQQWNDGSDQKKNNSNRSTANTNKANKTASTNKKKK